MIQIPVIDQVLVVPADLPGVAVQRQGGVVVEILLVRPLQQELGGGCRHGRTHEHQVEFVVVARHHPGADVAARFERHTAPGLVAVLAGRRDQTPPPDFFAGQGVEGDDNAGLGSAIRQAASPGHGLAARNDRPGALDGAVLGVVEDRGFPDHRPGLRIEGEQVEVDTGVDDQVAVDRDVPVVAAEQPAHPAGRLRGLPLVLPDQVARCRIQRFDHVVRIRHVHHAVVDQGRRRLAAPAQGPRPYLLELGDVLRGDLVQRAVTPGVVGPPPRQPILRRRVGQHCIGDRHEGG